MAFERYLEGILRVVIQGQFRLGNEIIKTMSAVWLAAAVGAKRLEAVWLPDFGIQTPVLGPVERPLALGCPDNMTVFPMERVLAAIEQYQPDVILDFLLAQRLEYFEPQLEFWRTLLSRPSLPVPGLGDGEVLIHIRADDILEPVHRGYYPLPLEFYDGVCDELGLNPVFVGLFDRSHPYLEALHFHFRDARFVSGTVAEDFELIRRSRVKVISISTFSWVAAWLGDVESKVIAPVGGMLDPRLWPDVNLSPVGDPRWRFRMLAPLERGTEEDLASFHARLVGESQRFPPGQPKLVRTDELDLPGVGASPEAYVELFGSVDWTSFAESLFALNTQGNPSSS